MGGCVPHQIEGGQVFAPSCMASQQCSSTLAAGGKGCQKEKNKLCIRHTTPPSPKKGQAHKQTNPPPHPNFSFLFFAPFFCFLFLFCFFVFVFFRFLVAREEQKTMRILFLFNPQHPTAHSTQHKAHSTQHRAQKTHTHTHTHILHNEAIRPKLEHKVVQG